MPLEKETKPAATAPARQAAHQPFFRPTATAPTHFFQAKAAQISKEDEPAAAQHESEQTDSTVTEEANESGISEIRTEVFKLFQLLNGKGVLAKPDSPLGSEDAVWKEITEHTQQSWNKRKNDEAPWDAWREYNNQLKSREIYLKAEEDAKAGKKKNLVPFVPVPKLVERPIGDPLTKVTTCILIQTKILSRAAQNLKSGYDTAHLMDPKMMKESPAWNWAQPHMEERPQPGDIFVLISLGEKLKKAKTDLTRAQNQSPKELKRLEDAHLKAVETLHGWESKAAAEREKIELLELKIQIIEANKIPNKNLLKQANAHRKELNGPIGIWKKNVAQARKALEDALSAKERAQKMLEDARTGEQFRTQLFFSHVGFFVSKEPMPGDPTKELWKTFDGGQTFTDGKATKQGAKYLERVYDPVTNEIWAKPHQKGQIESQDGQTRWFLGWYNLDKLVKPKEEKKPTAK